MYKSISVPLGALAQRQLQTDGNKEEMVRRLVEYDVQRKYSFKNEDALFQASSRSVICKFGH